MTLFLKARYHCQHVDVGLTWVKYGLLSGYGLKWAHFSNMGSTCEAFVGCLYEPHKEWKWAK